MKKFNNSWVPVILWCSLIYFLSSLPSLRTDFVGVIDLILRKGAHVTEYYILFVLTRRAFRNSFDGWKVSRTNIAAALFSVLYAASDEFHQSFVPTRGPSIGDVGIDSAGVIAGYFSYRFWEQARERKNESQ